jgi:bifunctional non-homologous end joining protein LigD
MPLNQYRAKRDFRQTHEPAGGKSKRVSPKQRPFFVVQKHDASRLHYDFRLEMDGVLKSWAIPKDFPFKRGERRLAVHVEDHPLEYADFEGTIPEGNYGAGTVMVWDRGVYHLHADDPAEALKSGKLHLTLSGQKLKGDWTLVRIRNPRDKGDQWLMLKSGENARPISTRASDTSVITKRSLRQIARDNDSQWQSNQPAHRAARPSPPAKISRPAKVTAAGKLPSAKPVFKEPMKALLVDALPQGPEWIYEVKFDGYRALAIKDGQKLSLLSRNGRDLSGRFPDISPELKKLPARQAVLDGEIVAIEPEGRSSFQLLQAYQQPGGPKPPLFYYAFDLLNLNGKDLSGLPLLQRKELLESLLANLSPFIRFSASIEAEPNLLATEMKARGLEGVVAKMKNSTYQFGQRRGAWVKFKWSLDQEFVIGGYTPPKGARTHFGAILVGYYEGDRLMYASKVGSGFDNKLLASLHQKFQELVRTSCPFANLPESSPGLTAAQMRKCTWLDPKLVCQISFTEWTRDNHLRHPLFLGLREDKTPKEVTREKPASII